MINALIMFALGLAGMAGLRRYQRDVSLRHARREHKARVSPPTVIGQPYALQKARPSSLTEALSIKNNIRRWPLMQAHTIKNTVLNSVSDISWTTARTYWWSSKLDGVVHRVFVFKLEAQETYVLRCDRQTAVAPQCVNQHLEGQGPVLTCIRCFRMPG